MFDSLKKLMSDVFTEPDNKTVCPVRIIGILGTMQGLGASAFDVFVNHAHFDLMAFGGGFGATIGALGLALGMKKDSK